jgi:hypothetical protein
VARGHAQDFFASLLDMFRETHVAYSNANGNKCPAVSEGISRQVSRWPCSFWNCFKQATGSGLRIRWLGLNALSRAPFEPMGARLRQRVLRGLHKRRNNAVSGRDTRHTQK